MPISTKQKRQRQGSIKSGGVSPRSRSSQKPGSSDGGDSDSGSRSSRLTRSKGERNLLSGQPEGRRARANALVDGDSSSPTVGKPPGLQRQDASRDVSKTQLKPDKDAKPRYDLGKGRMVYPVTQGGVTKYVPIQRDASDAEKDSGAFIKDDDISKEPVNELAKPGEVKSQTLRDFATGRTLFATTTVDKDGNTVVEYLPKRDEATAQELSQGKYVQNEAVEKDSIAKDVLDKRPKYDFGRGRDLFAVETADGIKYIPKKGDATAEELAAGLYVEDDAISSKAPLGAANAMSNKPPTFDIGKGRKLYGVTTPDGKTRYLPMESEASDREKLSGYFIPDKVVEDHERKRRRTAMKDDSADHALRRAQRADKLAGGVTRSNIDTPPRPVREAKDGTELWDGFSLPEVSREKQRETLSKLRPRYDLGKGRMVYPTEMPNGKIAYLPLARDASSQERVREYYAAFVPLEPLEQFLQRDDIIDDIAPQNFETEEGEVLAYAQADIKRAFEQAPQLVLRSAQFVSDVARETPELQQQFS